jgi:hypothetical protein
MSIHAIRTALLRWFWDFHPGARLNRTPVWTLLFLVLAVCLIEGSDLSQTQLVQTTGVDSAPSVVAAHEIKDGISTMLADVLSELDAPPGTNPALVKDFDRQLSRLQAGLLAAHRNITYTDDSAHLHPDEPLGELGPIGRLDKGYAELLQEVAKARVLHESDGARTLISARRLVAILSDQLIPAADALAKVNNAHFDAAYNRREQLYAEALWATRGAGGLILIVLALNQLFCSRTFRRTVNIYWLAAFVVAVVYLGFADVALVRANREAFNGGTNAYPSVVALHDARSLALQARAEQAMWILDEQGRAEHERRFNELTGRIAKPTAGHSLEEAIIQAQSGQPVIYLTEGVGDTTKSGGDAMRRELDNITYEGELAAATGTLKAFAAWLKLDPVIRKMELTGDHAGARALLLGTNPGQGVYLFDRFNDPDAQYGALGLTLKINADEQEKSIGVGGKAFWWLNILAYVTPVAAAAIFGLTILGWLHLRSRINPARFAHFGEASVVKGLVPATNT